MKKLVKCSFLVLFILILLGSTSFAESNYSIDFNHNIVLQKGQTVNYSDLFTLENCILDGEVIIEITSSDSSFVKINNETQTMEAVKAGECYGTIRVPFEVPSTGDNSFQYAVITIKIVESNFEPTIGLGQTSIGIYLNEDNAFQLNPKLNPNIINSKIVMTSFDYDNSIISVSDSGLIRGVSEGETSLNINFNVTLPNGLSYTTSKKVNVQVYGKNNINYKFQGNYDLTLIQGQTINYSELYKMQGAIVMDGTTVRFSGDTASNGLELNNNNETLTAVTPGVYHCVGHVPFIKASDKEVTFQEFSISITVVSSTDLPKASTTANTVTLVLNTDDNSYKIIPTWTPDIFGLTYSVSSANYNTSIINVAEDGTVTGKGTGTTNVTLNYSVDLPEGKKTTSSINFKVIVIDKPGTIDTSGLSTTAFTNTNNQNNQNYYAYYQNTVASNLVKENNVYMRVEATRMTTFDSTPRIIVNYFDNNFKFLGEKVVPLELPIYGGFYNSDNYYFLIEGQSNLSENPKQEVIRIIKYDKNWNKLDSSSILADNAVGLTKTYIPFDAGSLRIAETNGVLNILTSHEMFAGSDGLHHQSNLAFKMSMADMNSKRANFGYVSHSFNQFIKSDGDNIIALNHGDAYPRSAVLDVNYPGSLVDRKELLTYYGAIGENYTNATIGGLEISSTHYLTTGSSTDQTGNPTSVKNIYVTALSKTNPSEADVKITWLTQNTSGSVSAPHFVKLSSNAYLVLWTNTESRGTGTDNFSYAIINGQGDIVKGATSAQGTLSDCEPVVVNGYATWYVTNGNNIIFYALNGSGNLKTNTVEQPSTSTDKPNTNVPTTNNSTVYRVYNRITGEHLYTTDANEVSVLTRGDWNDEGVGWYGPTSGAPVFRLYSPITGFHLYTTDQNEVDTLSRERGWSIDNNGQPLFYSGGNKSIYRLYNEGLKQHLLTTDMNEYITLPSVGWKQEGAALNCLN